jgi:arylsulfatase A-like enzyme
MYDPDDLERWDSFDETFADKPAVHEQYLEYRGVADLDWEHWARAAAKYFGFVSFIDDQIGRIVAAIDEHLDAENTLVVHTSDHGDFTGSHRQFNKGPLMYEGTYHIPLVARWPAVVEPGVTCDAFVRLLDLMATFLDAGGVEPPQDVEARSLVPLLEGRVPEGWPETVFAEFHGDEFGLYSQRMVRSDRYKLVYNVPDTNELYDLRKDPAELHNLIDHPEYQETRREHERRLGEWMRETGDPLWPWTRKLLAD